MASTHPSAVSRLPALAAGLLAALLGAAAIVRWDIAARREAFAVDARIAHRLLSQRAAQLDAVLATLALVAPSSASAAAAAPAAAPSAPPADTHPPGTDAPAFRLPALWPAVLGVQVADANHPWPDAERAAADARSRSQPPAARHAALAQVDAAAGQYTLVLAGTPASWALRVDVKRLVPADEWPLSDAGPVRALLVAGPHTLVLHPGPPGAEQPQGLTAGFTFNKVLATPSQPFELRLQRATSPAQWPWGWLLAWAALCGATTAAALALQRARLAQRRNAALVRMAQTARLNTLGELAAGMAHELNQPLAALLAGTQAAQRLLQDATGPADDGPDLPAARQALGLAAAQARRASDVLARLRRLVQDPTRGAVLQAVDLHALCTQMLQLLAPELQRSGITSKISGHAPAVWADPVMLEQIVHNLVSNAMQALQSAGTPKPAITLTLQAQPTRGPSQQPQPKQQQQLQLLLRDNGPGFATEHIHQVFEPFFTTRAGGLGLGLPLCESLAQAMGGSLSARNVPAPGSGAELVLTLPLHTAPHAAPESAPETAPDAPPPP